MKHIFGLNLESFSSLQWFDAKIQLILIQAISNGRITKGNQRFPFNTKKTNCKQCRKMLQFAILRCTMNSIRGWNGFKIEFPIGAANTWTRCHYQSHTVRPMLTILDSKKWANKLKIVVKYFKRPLELLIAMKWSEKYLACMEFSDLFGTSPDLYAGFSHSQYALYYWP